jgi:acyl-CoA synthetase (AMP-forming)/AMP-acid ligase II
MKRLPSQRTQFDDEAGQSMPVAPRNLVELLEQRRESDATWLILPEDPIRSAAAQTLSFKQVYEASARVAASLLELDAQPGRVAGIVADNDEQFASLFFGVVLAGLVPAPLHLPSFVASTDTYESRIAHVLRETEAQFLVVSDEFDSVGKAIAPLRAWTAVSHRSLSTGLARASLPPLERRPDDLAMIQYSSGSTRTPLGAMLTHANVLYNIDAIGQTIGASEADVDLCWLPLFHDMGLTGAFLYSWYWGPPLVLMKPQDFIFRPACWLWAISRFRAATCPAPNFAYALCASAAKIPDAVLEGLDLSSWRLAFNGAEPVQARTIEKFVRRFAPYGFRETAMYPVYGLAENVLAACFPDCGRAPLVDWVDRRTLETRGVAQPVEKDSGSARPLVSVGRPLMKQHVRIVDDNGNAAKERTVGEIQIRGPSLMKGYHGKKVETADAFSADGWLRTGDLGYLAQGELYVTGRQKDIVKKAGAKYDAADIQAVVGAVSGVRPGCVAVFGIESDSRGTEQLVIVAEARFQTALELKRLRGEIRREINRVYALAIDVVELVAPGTLPKSSSGKIRTAECRSLYREHGFQSSSTSRQMESGA